MTFDQLVNVVINYKTQFGMEKLTKEQCIEIAEMMLDGFIKRSEDIDLIFLRCVDRLKKSKHVNETKKSNITSFEGVQWTPEITRALERNKGD